LVSVHFVTEEDVRIVETKISVEKTAIPVTEEKEVEITPAVPVKEGIKPAEVAASKEETPIIPIAAAAPVAEKQKVIPEEKIAEPKRRNRAWRYVAAACILPIAFYSVWIPVKTDVLESGMVSFSDFNPFHKRAEGLYEPVKKSSNAQTGKSEGRSLSKEVDELDEGTKVYTYMFTEDTYIKVELPETEASVPSENISETPVEPPVNETTTSFDANAMHYVVGCFGDKTNADNLVAKLKANGLDATVVDVKGGLHRVSAGGAISEEAYHTIKLKAEAIGLSGWRLR
jgi:hypothetical protein